MRYGTLKVVTKKDTYFVDITSLFNKRSVGEYCVGNWDNPPEYKEVLFDRGIAECYDISEDDFIEHIEIEEINTSSFETCSKDVEIVKDYYDFNIGARVIEFIQ